MTDKDKSVPSSDLLSAALRVVEASRCIRHWHDHGEGMVVSAEHVFKLWEALDAFDKATADNTLISDKPRNPEQAT